MPQITQLLSIREQKFELKFADSRGHILILQHIYLSLPIHPIVILQKELEAAGTLSVPAKVVLTVIPSP